MEIAVAPDMLTAEPGGEEVDVARRTLSAEERGRGGAVAVCLPDPER